MRHILVVALALGMTAAGPAKLVAQAPSIQSIAPRQQTLVSAGQLRLATPSFALVAPSGEAMTEGARGNQRQGEIRPKGLAR